MNNRHFRDEIVRIEARAQAARLYHLRGLWHEADRELDQVQLIAADLGRELTDRINLDARHGARDIARGPGSSPGSVGAALDGAVERHTEADLLQAQYSGGTTVRGNAVAPTGDLSEEDLTVHAGRHRSSKDPSDPSSGPTSAPHGHDDTNTASAAHGDQPVDVGSDDHTDTEPVDIPVTPHTVGKSWEMNFDCDLCGEPFETRGKLLSHRRAGCPADPLHGDVTFDDEPPAVSALPVTPQALGAHKRYQHNGDVQKPAPATVVKQERWSCPLCGQDDFVTPQALGAHKRTKHAAASMAGVRSPMDNRPETLEHTITREEFHRIRDNDHAEAS